MNADLIVAGIAVSGSLTGIVVGGLVTYASTKSIQAAKALHDSRIAAFSDFASAVMEFRRVLIDRWFLEDRGEQTADAARSVYEARSRAWSTLFKVELRWHR